VIILKLVTALVRIIVGFVLASIAAGFAMVMFVNTPSEVLTQPARQLPETAEHVLNLTLLSATQSALFAAVFVLIVAVVGELFSIRRPIFYLLFGAVIAFLGFVAQYMSETLGDPTVLNGYALAAFLTSGCLGGFVYWLAAGQFAGRAPGASSGSDARSTDRSAKPKSTPSDNAAAAAALDPIWKAQSS
jgi:MFS family permease